VRRNHVAWLMVMLVSAGLGCAGDIRDGFATRLDRGARWDAEPANVKDSPTPKISPQTHYASGLMLERQGDYVAAAAQFTKAADGDPKLLDAHNRLGMCYSRLGQFEGAAASFRDAVKLSPDAPALRNNLGFCLLSLQKYAEAEAACRKALELAPDFERARMNLAIALARQRRLGDAAVEFSRVLPPEAAYYNVGVICMEMSEMAPAEQAFREALAIKPDYEPARRRLDSLRHPSIDGAAPKRVQQDRRRIVEPPRVSVRANEPLRFTTLADDAKTDVHSP